MIHLAFKGHLVETRIDTIETRSLREQVYQYLCTRIIEGGIGYGETLNIKQIASRLSVSPMPVREAIKRLENEGIVTIKPRSTCLVKEPTKASILNAMELREILETYSVSKRASGESTIPLNGLADIVQRMKEEASDTPTQEVLRAYIALDRQFHTEICRLSGNQHIDKCYREVSLHLNMQFLFDIAVAPDTLSTVDEHEGIFRALEQGSAGAKELLRQHLRKSRANIMESRLFASLP
jgi:DNA-binding GntR family transcriptional regulator